ncbi:hypothetical protein D3C71_25190 [compost metagenome]
MDTEFLAGENAEGVLEALADSCDSMQWAVAWARPASGVLSAAYRHKRKFTRLILGTHFHQTDPEVLRKFGQERFARMMLPAGDTFHPKVYVFSKGKQVTAVVGSHNLTAKAFNGNAEMSVRLTGEASNPQFQKLFQFLDLQWTRAVRIPDHIEAYALQHRLKKRLVDELEQFDEGIARPNPKSEAPSPYELTWSAFLKRIKQDPRLESRLVVLERARELFQEAPGQRFGALSALGRKAIAGTYARREKTLDGLPWGWFGTMHGSGEFMHLVNESNVLWRAVDRIPLEGPVDREQFDEFCAGFKEAFRQKGSSRVGDLATASRLLALKRPDRFVALNSQNRRALCWAMGLSHTTLRLQDYWDAIVARMDLFPFWAAPAPHTGLSRRIWDGRAALMDCIYFEPDRAFPDLAA